MVGPPRVERKVNNFSSSCLRCSHKWESIIRPRQCPKCGKEQLEVDSFVNKKESSVTWNQLFKGKAEKPKLKIIIRPQHEPIQITKKLIEESRISPSSQKETKLSSTPHIIIDALAGTGKTFTIVESAFRICGINRGVTGSEEQEAVWDSFKGYQVNPNEIHLMAFNSSAAKNLKDRIPPGTHSSTIHSYGKQILCKNYIKGAQRKNGLDKYKTHTILSQITGKHKNTLFAEYKPAVMFAIKQYVGFCKANLVRFTNNDEDNIKLIDQLADKHGASLPDIKDEMVKEFFYASIIGCYEKSWQNTDIIDFDDMIWLPWKLSLDIRQTDLMFIDERQDLNLAQQELVYKSARRLVLVGDVNQAVYGFAGADTNACQRMSERLSYSNKGCSIFPLTFTRRCGSKIVEYARRNVPLFRSFPDSHPGEVIYDREEAFLDRVQSSDMVVCRTNAPIFRNCLKLMSQGRPFKTTVRDFFQGVIALLKSFDAFSLQELESRLDEWKEAQLAMCATARSEERARNINDQYTAIRFGMSSVSNPDELIKMIQKCFKTESDDKEQFDNWKDHILLTSIHQAKGLERPKVHFLQYDQLPHKKAKLLEQEKNLSYIADTRAMNTLNLVRSTPKKKGEDDFDD